MDLVYWIVFGFIAGFIASLISPHARGGLIGTTILGIIGAVVGGYIGERFFGVGITGFNLTSFVVAVAGSLAVLFISGLLLRRK